MQWTLSARLGVAHPEFVLIAAGVFLSYAVSVFTYLNEQNAFASGSFDYNSVAPWVLTSWQVTMDGPLQYQQHKRRQP